MSEEDEIIFLEYVPRFREVLMYIEIGVSLVEKHLMELMTSKHNAVLIEEIIDHDVNDAVGKELRADSGNSGKIPLVTFHQTSHVGKDGTIVATDFCVCDSDKEFPPPFQDEQDVSNDVDFDDVVFDDVSFNDVDFDDVSLDDVDFDVGMDDLVFEQELKEVFDEDVDQGIDVEWKDDPYHNVDEPEEINQPIDDEGGVVPFEVVVEEMVAEETVDGDDWGLYGAMVAQEMLEDQAGDVIPVEVVAEDNVVEETVVGSSGEDGDVVIPH
ncbi:hypothetical protein Tco_0217704 [Tanacetum coccineum]